MKALSLHAERILKPIVVSGDIDGGFANSGALSASGFRFTTRPGFGGSDETTGREDLTLEDLQEAGSALEISGNVSNGVILDRIFSESTRRKRRNSG